MTKLTNAEFRALNSKGILTANADIPVTASNINGLAAGPFTYIQKDAVEALVAPMMFEKFVGGMEKQGSWGDKVVTIKLAELIGRPQSYVAGDSSSTGGNESELSLNYVNRGVYYGESSWGIDDLEVATLGKMSEDGMARKAAACMLGIAIERNQVAFLGKTDKGLTTPVYGLLNDPAITQINSTIPTVAAGASTDTEWSTKTPDEIVNDIVNMVNELGIQSEGSSFEYFGAGKEYRLGVASSVYGQLDRTNSFGLSARAKLKENYGDKLKLFPIPQMNGYASGDNIMMMIIDATDNTQTAKGGFTELARAFQIDRKGSYTSQKIAFAISGCVVQRPTLVYTAKGI